MCFHKSRGENGGGVSERRIVRSRGNQGLLLLTELHLDGYALHCLSPNQPQSINHLPQPASQINQVSSAPSLCLPGSGCTSQSSVTGRCKSPYQSTLEQHSIFKYRLINLNELYLKKQFQGIFHIHVILLVWWLNNADTGGVQQEIHTKGKQSQLHLHKIRVYVLFEKKMSQTSFSIATYMHF